MTNDTPRNVGPTFTQFPPIPLLSGDTFRDDDGTPHRLQSVIVTMTATDGTTRDVPLEYRFGGWWPPAGGPSA